MKVAELRSALELRGLDSSGKKQELQERLRAALEKEAAAAQGVTNGTDHGPRTEQATQLLSESEDKVGATETGAAPLSAGLPGTAEHQASEPRKTKVTETDEPTREGGDAEKTPRKLTDEELEEFLSPSEREQVEKAKTRANRFQVPYTGLPLDLRRSALSRYHKRRRFEKALERHGGLVPVDDAEEERRRKRMERFGLSKPVLELEAEERERQRQERQAKGMDKQHGLQRNTETPNPDTLSPPQAKRHEEESAAAQSDDVDV
jgi:hypothetical protein